MFGFGPKVPSVDAEELKKALDEKNEMIVLDVRTRDEYSRGKIRGSINLPLDEVTKKIEKLVPDKNKTMYVYCFSGSRSVVAVDAMVKLGYKHVYNVKSGVLAWRAKQYPLEN